MDKVYPPAPRYKYGFPPKYTDRYFRLINHFIPWAKEIIADIIEQTETPIRMPMTIDPIKNYLSGFQIKLVPFSKSRDHIDAEGFYDIDYDSGIIHIYHNLDAPEVRQRFTIIHELFHVIQRLDDNFCSQIDKISLANFLPPEAISKLIDKVADKAAGMYLMPNDYFLKKFQEGRGLLELAQMFGVAQTTAAYRLKEVVLLKF